MEQKNKGFKKKSRRRNYSEQDNTQIIDEELFNELTLIEDEILQFDKTIHSNFQEDKAKKYHEDQELNNKLQNDSNDQVGGISAKGFNRSLDQQQ